MIRFRSIAVLLVTALTAFAQHASPQSASSPNLKDLVSVVQQKARVLENSPAMRASFSSFTSSFHLNDRDVSYSDFVIVRLLFQATRDAGFWNLHWDITNQPPNSDRIWKQWKEERQPSFALPTATAECDELSALYAFLAKRSGVDGNGLFWPTYNHTVAVWVLKPEGRAPVRVVVPTTQIFLDETDFFGTRKFDPWHQKTISTYSRHDVPDTFEIPKPLFDFFLLQIQKYAGASDNTLQKLRYLREGVFRSTWSREAVAQEAMKRSTDPSLSADDRAAYENFARDMRAAPLR